MTERIVRANGIDLWTEDFGDRADPPLLLIMGASAQGIQWPDEFVQRLVDNGRYVIRFDNRDTGCSTCFDFAKNPYTLDDLTSDAVGLLDAYDLASAHVAGASMGGMIVQNLMIRHPTRLRSATIIMSSPLGGSDDGQPALGSGDLPGPDAAWLEDLMSIQSRAAETPEDRIALRAALFEKLTGSLPVDHDRIRATAAREVARAVNFAAQANHALAIARSKPNDRRPLLSQTSVPTLVVHGTEDPILPLAHGRALADAIPGAQFLAFEGMGHDLPEVLWNAMIDAMIRLGSRDSSAHVR